MDQTTVTRSRNRLIAGVCGGLADRLGWSPDRFRFAYVLLSLFSAAFPGILVYIVLWIVMPDADDARPEVMAGPPPERF